MRDEQAAEQNLGKKDGGHELDGLELSLGERTEKKTECHPEQSIDDGKEYYRPGWSKCAHAEKSEADGAARLPTLPLGALRGVL